jgi:cell wall-associated NlpC family hydrolase
MSVARPVDRRAARRLALALLLAGVVLAETVRAQDASAADDVAARRAAILERARAYAEHRWTASPANVLHGADADGVLVHTPDRSQRPDGWLPDGTENVGVPYKWGGFSSLDEFDAAVAAGRPAGELTDGIDLASSAHSVGVDCSGFVQYVFAQHAVALPHAVSEQYRIGRPVPPADLAPGDLIFFTTVAPGASHVGIAIGGDEFVHAPSSRGEVRVERLSASYWSRRFVGARRVL